MNREIKDSLAIIFCLCYIFLGVILFNDLLTISIVVLQSIFLYWVYTLDRATETNKPDEIKATRLGNK